MSLSLRLKASDESLLKMSIGFYILIIAAIIASFGAMIAVFNKGFDDVSGAFLAVGLGLCFLTTLFEMMETYEKDKSFTDIGYCNDSTSYVKVCFAERRIFKSNTMKKVIVRPHDTVYLMNSKIISTLPIENADF